jgi:hypothetical protein
MKCVVFNSTEWGNNLIGEIVKEERTMLGTIYHIKYGNRVVKTTQIVKKL